jgi:DNA-binding transcriptional LysR family regulator
MSDRRIEDIRFADVMTFLAVHRNRSVTAAARELSVTASQVSKAIARLESALRMPLLIRGTRGVAPSPSAMSMIPRLEDLVAKARDLGTSEKTEEQLSIAAPSYLCTGFFGAVVKAYPAAHIRCLEVGPAFIRAYAAENLFQVALTLGEQRMTSSWVSETVGSVRSGLFAAKEVRERLGPNPGVAQIVKEPFVIPLYNAGGEFLPGDDGCPIPREDRIRGHEAATYAVALEIAAHADMLVFGPVSATVGYVAAGRLVEIPVPGWAVSSELYLHVNENRVLKHVQTRLMKALQKVVLEVPG